MLSITIVQAAINYMSTCGTIGYEVALHIIKVNIMDRFASIKNPKRLIIYIYIYIATYFL